MRRSLLFSACAVALAGCDLRAKAAAEAKHAEMERRMLEIEVRLEQLETENRALRLELQRTTAAAADSVIASGAGPHCTGDGSGARYAITRANVDAIFSDASTAASSARVVPSFKDGVAQGFKLFSIRPGTVFATCGFRNGDVVKSVNGHEIDSPDEALDAYTKLKSATRAVFEVERAGGPYVITIELKD